jgi:hypothetical protein
VRNYAYYYARKIPGNVRNGVVKDWRTHKYLFFGVILFLATTLLVAAYYVNHPRPEPQADTWSYLYVVDRFQAHGQLVNFWRLPGYPLFIVLVYTLLGQGNLGAVSLVQAILFVLATLEIYVLCILVLRRTWIALLVGLLVGLNVPLLSYMKPIMSEALALWLVVSLALACVFFLFTLQAWRLWLVTACTLLLVFTRPEWIFLPLPLFAYLLLVALWRGRARGLLLPALASIFLLYALLGGYVYINATQNHYPGLTWIEDINALGKVLQYNMQDEAPPQYAHISRILDKYVARDIRDPYVILASEPSLSSGLAGQFARSTIERHPVEFLVKSVPVFFSSLTVYYEGSPIAPQASFARPLTWLDAIFHTLYRLNICFPFFAEIWLVLLFWRRTRQLRTVQMMGGIVLLALYGLVSMTLGAYRNYDYMRIHTLFDPLVILIMWGTLSLGAALLIQHCPDMRAWLADHSFLRWKAM